MKMVMVVFDAAYQDSVMETFDAMDVHGFTHWPKVLGRGERSDPKMDSAVWPGFNEAVAAAVAHDRADALMDALGRLTDELGGKGIKTFSWRLDRVV